MSAVLVVLGAALGAPARYLTDRLLQGWRGSANHHWAFPWGTFAVNVTGAFVLGVVAGALSGDAYTLVGTGLLGAYTTFSTWMLETHRLGEDGRLPLGFLNFGVSLAVGITAVWLGSQL